MGLLYLDSSIIDDRIPRNCASPLVTGVKGAIFRKVATMEQGIRGMISAIDDNLAEYI